MPPRITLVIHALDAGGAQRVLAWMANHWASEGVEVTVITLAARDSDRYALTDRVRRIELNLMGHSRGKWQAVKNNWRRIRALRRAIVEAGAEHVVSFTDKMNITTLLACRGLSKRIVIAERSDPRHQNMGRLWEWLRLWVWSWWPWRR